ncbi:MAG: hypothetical protein WC427_01485 [Candidatus Paceibacterota bacterium]
MKEIKTTLELRNIKGIEDQEVKEITISVSMPFLDDSFIFKNVSIAIEILALILFKILISMPKNNKASYEKLRMLNEGIVEISEAIDKKRE